MHKDNSHIQEFFQKELEELNTEQMLVNHELRFLEKLENKKQKKTNSFKFFGVAASIVLLLGLFLFNSRNEVGVTEETIPYPQEVAEAHQYYDGIIMKEIARLQAFKNEDNSALITDTVTELNKLKIEEEQLLTQLTINYNERIVKALIDNFQIRINLLQNVMQQIKEINQLKNEYHEEII